MHDSPREWAAGRWWQWRLPLLILLALQAAKPLREMTGHIFAGITFGGHEFGHLFFGLTGNQWWTIAGGSLMQLLIPIGAAAAVMQKRDWFGASICGLFLASALGDLSWYIGDARAQDLDLVSFSPDGGGHDWAFLLKRAKLLPKDHAIASFTRFVGWIVLLASSAFAVRLMWWMKTEKVPEPT